MITTIIFMFTAAPSSEIPPSLPVIGNCSDGFYRENGSLACIASCYTWVQYDNLTAVVIDVLIGLSGVVAFLGAIVVIVLAGLQYKKVYVTSGVEYSLADWVWSQ